jgi:hypothetical protein
MKLKRCLSGAPQARSEFFSARLHRASQGTRPQAGRRCSRSTFAYFWGAKSRSHQPAQRARETLLTFTLKNDQPAATAE